MALFENTVENYPPPRKKTCNHRLGRIERGHQVAMTADQRGHKRRLLLTVNDGTERSTDVNARQRALIKRRPEH